MMANALNHLNAYYLANRRLPWGLIGLSITASWFGAASTLATLDALATRGLNGLWDIVIPSLLSVGLVWVWLGLRMASWTHCHQRLSMAEAMETAYGPWGRWGFAVIIAAATTTMLAAQLVAAGGLLQGVLGTPFEFIVWSVALLVGGYSALGGYRLVVMTDGLQLGLIGLGLLIPLVWLVGFSGLFQLEAFSDALIVAPKQLIPTPEQLGTVGAFVAGWVVAPEMWQRMQSLPQPSQARLTVGMGLLGLVILFSLVNTVGLLAGSLALLMPEGGATTGQVWVGLAQAMPHPALGGVMMLGILAAIASTMDSSLNVGSLALSHDVVVPMVHRCRKNFLTQATQLRFAQGLGILMMAVAAIIAVRFQDVLHVLWLSADLYATVMLIPMVMVLASYAKQSSPSRWGGLAAMGSGFFVTVLLRLLPWLGAPLSEQWVFPWATWWGIGAAMVAYWVGAILEGRLKPTSAQ